MKLPFRFNPFLKPGVYVILNKVTRKRYVGEASNLARRFSDYYSQLINKKHSCKSLQRDWNKYGAKLFDFIILETGFYCYNRVKRLG